MQRELRTRMRGQLVQQRVVLDSRNGDVRSKEGVRHEDRLLGAAAQRHGPHVQLKRAVEQRPNLFNGNTTPGNDLGRDGDVYFLTE